MTENRTIQKNQLQCNLLALYMLGIFAQFYVVCRFDFFLKSDAFKKYFGKTIRVSNNLNPDHDLIPNYLKKLSAGDKSRGL